MPRPDQIRIGLNYARDATRSVARAVYAEEKKVDARVLAMESSAAEASTNLEKRTAGPAWAQTKVGRRAWGLLNKVVFKRAIKKLRAAKEDADTALEAEILVQKRKSSDRVRFVRLARTLAEAADRADDYTKIPSAMIAEAKDILRNLAISRTMRKRDRKGLYDTSLRLVTLLKEIDRSRKAARQASVVAAPSPKPVLQQAPPKTASDRVYLPIPYSLGFHAKQAGARYDKEAGTGGSSWYVPIGADLAKFEGMLPLSFRANPPKLSFPPVRHQASSQNLWSIFDEQTWSHIKHINYQQTGKRCMLCGKQSGHLVRVLEDNAERRIGKVDSHEIWDWSVPDPSSGVGIQKLKGLMVLCYECHMCFHEGFAKGRAKLQGKEDAVAIFLRQRRSLITRIDPRTLQEQMSREAQRLRAHAGVKHWIMDLSHLGNQDYMRQVTPVFNEVNIPGVRASEVAGLAFVTDAGIQYESVPAETLLDSVTSLYRRVSVIDFSRSKSL